MPIVFKFFHVHSSFLFICHSRESGNPDKPGKPCPRVSGDQTGLDNCLGLIFKDFLSLY